MFTSYEGIGNREDLIDLITIISNEKTPFMSSIGSVRAKARIHEWQTDVLDTPGANSNAENATVSTATSITPTTRVTNQTQILTKDFEITDTQEIVDKAGRSSEINYQTMLKMKALATDVEYAMVVNSTAVSGASGAARIMKGLSGFISDNVGTGASAGRDLTSSLLDAILQEAWADGGNPDMILCGGKQKRQFTDTTDFPGITREISAEANKIVNNVSIYESPFGTLRVMLSHVMNASLNSVLFAVETKRYRKAWLKPPKRKELPVSGLSRGFLLSTEVTLESLNEKSSAALKQLNT
jgi:hypothetical protein